MPDKKIRLFIAIDIPQEIRAVLAGTIEGTRPAMPDVKWVKAENLHLTLKFVGYFDPDKLEGLLDITRKIARRFPAFRVRLGSSGAFTSPRRARVIWVGMLQGTEESARLAEKLDARLEKVGVKREGRPFAGHLTLARLRQPRDCSAELAYIANRLEGLEDMEFEVSEIVVYRSILRPDGPVYEALERIPLKGK
jgi:2'-5' RNA ligase